VLINQRTAIGHGSTLGDFSQVCPGAQINGDCRIGAGALVGSNASIHQGKSVGDNATVGANSLVVRSVAPGQSVMGIPARPFFTNPPPSHD
jgi:acetyltransferase-like isoleucine patch superfamily enzyme